MNQMMACPMCGATIRVGAKRCLDCGESFQPHAREQNLLRIRVTKAGVVSGAIVGTSIGLLGAFGAWISLSDPQDLIEATAFLLIGGLGLGAASGSAVAAILTKFRRRASGTTPR
jgi:hypothetical protein